MNPLYIARNLRDEYLKLLRTHFHPRQDELREAFDQEIERDGFLTREPYVALAHAYETGAPLDGLHPVAEDRFGPICRTPYRHQAEAAGRIMQGMPVVVATGTGSGKTEAFLMPIVDHCLRVHKEGEHSVKAILIYPMNALANDQCGRIRKLLEGTDVSYGRYTRETRVYGARPKDAPPNERITRQEFRQQPPDILLTNYMMLEYMLMRGDGRDIFKNHQLRFVVLDEVHTYHGLLGTDVACLLRRLRESLRRSGSGEAPLFIGTSATLQAGEEGDPRVGISRFFSRLTGQETPPESVVTEYSETPSVPADGMLPPPPTLTDDQLEQFNAGNAAKVNEVVAALTRTPVSSLRERRTAWHSALLPYLLTSWLQKPVSLEEIVDALAERPERSGVARDDLRREVEAALLVGPCVDEDSDVKLRPRVHRFLRGLAPFWRCTNPDCGKLLGEGITECDACRAQALPLAMCRTCGWDFLVGKHGPDSTVLPWDYRLHRISRPNTVFLYDPPRERIAVDEEEDPGAEEAETEGTQGSEESAAEADDGRREEPDQYLRTADLKLVDASSESGSLPLRPVKIHVGRGTRCPVCGSRYGRYDVLTPVSMGNSSALTHVARVLMRNLPEQERKLLVFCDSRQDAAHQARFIEGIEQHLRLRRLVYSVLQGDPGLHDFDWVVDHLYEAYIEDGVYPPTRKRDERDRRVCAIQGALLTEFAIAPRVRASVERLGLVVVQHAGLDEELKSEEFLRLCAEHQLVPELAAYSVHVVLAEMRQRMALSHEALKTRLYPHDKLSRRYGLSVNRQVGIPVAFLLPGQVSAKGRAFKLLSTWNYKGAQPVLQRLWRQFHAEYATPESLDAVMRWLTDKGREYLVEVRIGGKTETGSGYQVNLEMLEFEVGRTFLRCSVCDRVMANADSGRPCPRPGCRGTLDPWQGAMAEGNLNALMAVENYAPPLYAAEHSAAVTDEKREEAERGFTDLVPAKPNVLACTPTLELGVNIGDLEAVAMRNIPPSPANYAQRSGRTGRTSRMGMTVGFSRNTPHDGYFFDHPDEVIAGAIPPPKLNLQNREAVGRHMRSLILEHAAMDFPTNLEPFLTEKGQLIEQRVEDLVKKVAGAGPDAVKVATKLWDDIPSVTPEWLVQISEHFPAGVRRVLEQRGSLLAQAAEEVRKLGEKVELTEQERRAQDGYRLLAIRLRKDNRYAYLPRVLAEAGLLPGYSFPADPGSVSMGYDPEPIFGSRLQAQREFAPGQVIYARGGRWRVGGVALHRPGAADLREESRFDFTLCPSCGLANAPGNSYCVRCKSAIGDDEGGGLQTFTAWDAAAFQAWENEVAPESEEERMVSLFDIRPHPQFDTAGSSFQVGHWRLDLRHQEEIWFINHGRKIDQFGDSERARSPGFILCPSCGEFFGDGEKEEEAPKQKAGARDPRSQQDTHAQRCPGKQRPFSLGHKLHADTLRLVLPDMAGMGAEGQRWAWSFVYTVIHGAMRLFEIDEDDIEGFVLTKTVRTDGSSREEVLDVLWIDRVIGGSGTLERLARQFPQVAAAALEHLQGHDCPSSCYRCLRGYRNQKWHKILDWRLAIPYLKGLQGEEVKEVGAIEGAVPPPPTYGPEWDEARAEGCESPQELRLLKAIRDDRSLSEPEKQHEVRDEGRLLTRADFAYLDCSPKLLIYVDGLVWHSGIRQRVHDHRITNRLQMLGYRVLRFMGTETHNSPGRCVAQIKEARSDERSG
ncbi:DEAD/DEAH box helicase [Verrucomicrobiota bacterium]